MGRALWKTVWNVPSKIKRNIKLAHDPAIPLLGVDPEDSKVETGIDVRIPMFTAALLRMAKRWK